MLFRSSGTRGPLHALLDEVLAKSEAERASQRDVRLVVDVDPIDML